MSGGSFAKRTMTASGKASWRSKSIDMLPAEVHGEARSKERCKRGAAVAGSGDAHRESLVLFGKPSGAKRQSDAEARAGDAQQNSHARTS